GRGARDARPQGPREHEDPGARDGPLTRTRRVPPVLWTPSAERVERAWLTRFAREVGIGRGYDELWRWSVDDLTGFWGAVHSFFGVAGGYDAVLGRREMPSTQWFPGAVLSYAEH